MTDSGHLLSLIIVSPGRAGTFSRDFTTILALESGAFSGALKIEKLKAPLIPGLEEAVETNDWCTITTQYTCTTLQEYLGSVYIFSIKLSIVDSARYLWLVT